MPKRHDMFAVSDTLFENTTTILYRGIRQEDGKKVILKAMKRAEDEHLLRHEYELLKNRRIDGVANVLALLQDEEEQTCLVSEDDGGLVLEEYLQRLEASGKPMDTLTFLRIAEHAAASLARIHAEKIVCRDITPAHLMVDPDTLMVRYIDFGLAQQVQRETEMRQETVEGTLEYLSPEQTGRVRRAVDYRSDIYALGVVLYRALTGRLPFAGKTTMELIHQHLAVAPTPPAELVEVPRILSDGILKMLEKRPEDRYQTAEALAYDFERCRRRLAAGKDVERFRLAEKDIFYNLGPGKKLYGRADTVDSLKKAFDSIGRHRPELVLIEGAHADGLTLLLQELETYAFQHNSLVFRGKTEKAEDREPYHALRQVFGRFDALVYRSRIPLSAYRESILQALGDNAQVLIEVLPQMQNVLGKQTPVPVLGGMEAQRRAEEVFRIFLETLCDVPYPCVFVFEGAQEMDDASLRLLLSALENPDLGNCMVTLACEDGEAGAGARVRQVVETGGLRHVSRHTLHVHPISQGGILEIIQDIFPQPEESAQALAQYVDAYALGEMRRIEAFLKELYHSGVIFYDEASDAWTWNRDAVNPTYFQDIQERVKLLLASLPKAAGRYLRTLACIGQEIPMAWALAVLPEGRSEKVMLRTLRPALEEGVLAYDAALQLLTFESNRVHQAVYTACEPAWREEAHLDIGRRLYQLYQEEETGLIAHGAKILSQLEQAAARWAPEDRYCVVRVARLAGDDAMRTLNIEKAMQLYAPALQLLGEDAGANIEAYGDVLGLLTQAASGAFTLGRADEATRLYRKALGHTRTEAQRFTVYQQMVQQYIQAGDWDIAGSLASEYLAGISALPGGTPDTVAEKERFQQHLQQEGIEYFLRATLQEEGENRYIGSMLVVLAEADSRSAAPQAGYYLYRALNQAYDHGPFPDLERALALLGVEMANAGAYAQAEDLCNFGIIFAEMNDLAQTPLWAAYCLYVLPWVESIERVPDVYQKTKHIATLEGNQIYGAALDLMLLSYSLYTDVPLAQLGQDIEIAMQNSEKYGPPREHAVFAGAFRQFVRCMTGHTLRMDSFDDRSFDEADWRAGLSPGDRRYAEQFYAACRVQALYTHGFDAEAEACAGQFLSSGGADALLARVQLYYYRALALCRMCRTGAAHIAQHGETVEACLRALADAAEQMPGNFAEKHRLLALEWARAEKGDDHIAEVEAYTALGDAFRERRYRWDEALVQQRLMEIWANRGIPQYEALHRRNAQALYQELDAGPKALQFAQHGPEAQTASLQGAQAQLETGREAVEAAEYRAILRAIGQLASETSLSSLLQRLLNLLLENGDADKGMVFLAQEEEGMQLQAFLYADASTQELMSQELPVSLRSIAGDVLPHKLVALASDRRTDLVANAADNEYVFLGDDYLEKHRPESFLCLPVLAGNKALGVVYLENARLAGMFPPHRVGILHTILQQAALLIQNALEIRSMEGYAATLEKQLTAYINQSNTLIAGIAHEVNTPLGVCVTVATRLDESARQVYGAFTDRKLSKTGFEDFLKESQEGLALLMKNTTRASELVQNFKQVSVNQSNEVFEEVEMMETLRNIVEYIRPATKRVIESCTLTGPERVLLYTSPGAVAQVFTNLLMNSTNHAFPGREKRENLVTLEVSETPEEVQIVYSDNGRGMSEEEKERIFVPFFTTARGEGGSGLGGYIIMTQVTQVLGGAVHCISEPGRGTSFIIRLPKRNA